MIHSITLSPIESGNHSTFVDGKYYDKEKGQTITLLNNYGVVTSDRVLAANETVWIQWFKTNAPTFVLTWDDEKENGKKIAEWVKYLKRHDNIKCDGNTNAVKAPQFKLVDSRQVYVERADAIKTKLAVGNLINNMRASQLMEVAYFTGANPIGKTTEQIFAELCDFDLGKCMVNPARFLAEWKAPDRSHTVYAKKAVTLEIIKLDNGVYKFNNASIGGTHDEIVVFLKNNPDLYDNYIKKQVQAEDRLPVSINEDILVSDILDKKPKTESTSTKKTETEKANGRAERKVEATAQEDERQKLIGEMKQLGVPGAQLADKGGWSIEAIKKAIEKHKEKALVTA